jgi:alkylation response protein AidB-like acyl-CoA dehydrogenase
MVSFTPTDEQRMLVEAIHRYAEDVVRGIAHEADEAASIPDHVIKTGWEIGLIPASLPEDYGGFGQREALTGVLAAEELAWGDLAVALKVLTPALVAYPVLMCGTEAQKRDLLPRFCEDYPPLTAALAEPGLFFVPQTMTTTATVEDGHVVLNGVKANVPLAGEAELILVYARNADNGEIGAYLAERDQMEDSRS